MTISLSCDMMKDITEESHRENTMVMKFTTTQTIFTGWGALQESSAALSGLGKKPLVVTSAGTWKRMGAQLAEQLSGCFSAYAVCDCINSEPTDVMIAEGLAAYQKNGCDCLIGIGGGSPLDAMKAIAVGTTSSAPLASYMGKEISGALPSMAAIPTTAGTGSEVTKFTIITDTKTDVKMLLKGEVLLPQLAIVDASLSESTPQSVTAATGLDALTHAIEAYTSKQAQPLTDALAVSAVKRIFSYLPAAYRDGKNRKAREEMAAAALEAGICINNSSVTIVHGMSRPIGALFHVPHGLSNAMLLEKCLQFALPGCYERFGALGCAIGAAPADSSDAAAADALLAAVKQLCRTCEVPSPEQYGISRTAFFDVIEKMSADAIASGSPGNTRRAVSAADCAAIYRSLWET